jgi:hypothetical protein
LWWPVRGGGAYRAAGRFLSVLADGLRRQTAGRHVPRLNAAGVSDVDLTDPRSRQQGREDDSHAARAADLDPLGAAGRQAPGGIARRTGDQ